MDGEPDGSEGPDGTDATSEGASPPRVPAWVKVLGVVLLLFLAGFAALHLLGQAPTGH